MSRLQTRIVPWLLLWGLLAACTSPPQTPAPVHVSALSLSAPERIMAGDALVIDIDVQSDSQTPLTVTLLLYGSFGARLQPIQVSGGSARLSLDPAVTQSAGALRLVASSGGIDATAATEIVPGSAVDPLLTLVGPRSIRAGGEDWTMLVAAPLDQFGNPVASGTPVEIAVLHPADEIDATNAERVRVETRHLLSWERIFGRRRAGPMSFAATSEDAHSPERTIRVVADLATDIALTASPLSLPADGRQLVRVQTNQITDRYGNVLDDGTHLLFIAAIDGRRRTIPAETVDGRAYATLQAGDDPGILQVSATIAGVSSPPLQIVFQPSTALQPFAITVTMDTEHITFRAGPVLGAIGQFAADGTEIDFEISGPQGSVLKERGVIDAGYSLISVRRSQLARGEYRVRASAGNRQVETSFMAP